MRARFDNLTKHDNNSNYPADSYLDDTQPDRDDDDDDYDYDCSTYNGQYDLATMIMNKVALACERSLTSAQLRWLRVAAASELSRRTTLC